MISHDKKGRVSFGKWDFVIQGLILLSLVSFSIETLPNLDSRWLPWLRGFEILTVAIFTLEYFLRIFLCKPRFSYAFSFFGLVDILSILPFYLALGVDLRSFRSVRLLRLFRLLKLARYGSAITRINRAFNIAKEELVLFGVSALILLYIASVGIYYCENSSQPETFSSIFACFWWALTTLTTVGYGDMAPVTVGGKLFTFIILILGLGLVAVPTGLFATALSQAKDEEKRPK